MRSTEMLALLQRAPLGYVIVRVNGSHHVMEAAGRPRVVLACHAGQTLPPGLVRKILLKDVGLDADTALAILSR